MASGKRRCTFKIHSGTNQFQAGLRHRVDSKYAVSSIVKSHCGVPLGIRADNGFATWLPLRGAYRSHFVKGIGMGRVVQQIITGPFFLNTRTISGPATRVSVGTGYPLTEGSLVNRSWVKTISVYTGHGQPSCYLSLRRPPPHEWVHTAQRGGARASNLAVYGEATVLISVSLSPNRSSGYQHSTHSYSPVRSRPW